MGTDYSHFPDEKYVNFKKLITVYYYLRTVFA